MKDIISLNYDVPKDFTRAGEASGKVKSILKKMGVAPDIVRKVAIVMYEGEINMVIHASGGNITVDISSDGIKIVLCDDGPGIENIELALQAGYSTAPDKIRSLGFGAGMGLPNMQKYSDKLIVNSKLGEGTSIIAQIDMI